MLCFIETNKLIPDPVQRVRAQKKGLAEREAAWENENVA